MKIKASSPSQKILMTYAALMILLALTFFLAKINLGPLNTALGLLIASAKALLVALFFMQLEKSEGVHRLAALVGVFWLGILISLTLSDYTSRNWLAMPALWPPLR